jgi:uncharacterized membrane protein/Mg-chelatase subunit ChlD
MTYFRNPQSEIRNSEPYMFDYQLDFASPWYLLLLGLLPLLWWFSFRSLAGLGNIRRLVAIGLRSAVLLAIIFALADIELKQTSERLTVIYLLDQSLSIPEAQRKEMVEYVNASIRRHRKNDDRAGVIVFGREAAVEIPPFDDNVQVAQTIETMPDPEHTNLAAALKLAQASFPPDSARRVVVVSDGNENLGSALDQAQAMSEAGVSIDVHPVRFGTLAEVAVEKVTIPSEVRKGQPFDLRVVLNNTTPATDEDPGIVEGTLTIYEKTDDQPQVIAEQPVKLKPGKEVFTQKITIDQPAFYSYEAQFVPADKKSDGMSQNNRATAFSHVRGSGQVLLIEDQENPGEHEFLIDRLRKENIEVTVRNSAQLFTSLAELQPFDSVILANVPRSSGTDADNVSNFSDDQIKMLVRNTETLGCGLIMLGGPNSFGAGGWTNTELEKAMPVDFQIKSAKVVPKGALALVMHASELADGNHWQKRIAAEAIKALGSQDYCGLLHWNGTETWLWNHPKGMVTVGPNRNKMLAYLDRMAPGDMPDFDPTMKMALKTMNGLPDAAVKHMIVISDGDPSPPSPSVVRAIANAKITVSTVAVGTHGPANSAVLKALATDTGGKYYEVKNNNALPRIFQREARRVARPLVYEKPEGFSPQINYPHEMLNGINGPLPPITGYVMTTLKENPLVELSILSPMPPAGENNTVMASWTYGLGRTVVFTADAGARWSTAWTDWSGYDKFFSQMVRWSMRPTGDLGKFSVATDVSDGKVKVIVTAIDKDDEYINMLNLSGMAIGPDMNTHELKMEQVAPGRYQGEFNAGDSGSYFVMLNPGAGQAPIQTGINVPYSAEFRERSTNEPLLTTLANLKPKGGASGKLIEGSKGDDTLDNLLKINTFRHDLPKAFSSQQAWFYLVLLAVCVFFFDVFVRRVTVNLDWLPPLVIRVRDRLLGRELQPVKVEYMERLRSRKAEITEHFEQKRAAARFEPAPDATASTSALDEELAGTSPSPDKPAASKPTAGLKPQQEEETYTDRLLKAKKKVWENRDRPQ